MILIVILEATAIIALALAWWNRRVHVRDCHKIIRDMAGKLAKVHAQRMGALERARQVNVSQRRVILDRASQLRRELGLVAND